MLVGIVLWVCVLKSGVHATLAGVALALRDPARAAPGERSPQRRLEHDLAAVGGVRHPAAVRLCQCRAVLCRPLARDRCSQPVPLGIAVGLFLGKQIGVFGCGAAGDPLGWAGLPAGASWIGLYGTSILTGVGFTMSLFIGTLAFGQSELEAFMRLGVLVGSALSAVVGAAVLGFSPARPSSESRSA